MSPAPAPRAFYATASDRRRTAHTHCGDCGVALPGRRAVDVTDPPRPRHPCAYSDLRECPGCHQPIVRRLPDGAPFEPGLTPHACADGDVAADPWAPLERLLRRQAAAEARERDREAALYAQWVAYRQAVGLPDAGEAELPDPRAGGRS